MGTRMLYNSNDLSLLFTNLDSIEVDHSLTFEEWAVYLRAKNPQNVLVNRDDRLLWKLFSQVD